MSILLTIMALAKVSAPTVKRSPKWTGVRKKHLVLHPTCACCGGTKNIEVHHIQPFNDHPELELDPKNLITLCESASDGIICHLGVGHLGDYKSYNVDIVKDAAYLLNKITNRP